MILIDSREPKSTISLLTIKGLEFKREFLDIGDYLLPDSTIIERKTGPDFLHSIIDGRLWSQAGSLSQYKHPIIVIISKDLWKDMYFSKGRYIHKSYYGAVSTLLSSYNISVINFISEEDFVDFLDSLHKKILKEKPSSRPSPLVRKAKTIEERKENCLSMIEGISVNKAKLLLKEFKNIKTISEKSIKELESVKGIGKKLAENIYNTLN